MNRATFLKSIALGSAYLAVGGISLKLSEPEFLPTSFIYGGFTGNEWCKDDFTSQLTGFYNSLAQEWLLKGK